MRILSVVGNRPQFIKSGPVSTALRGRAEEIVLHTGQHYDPELSQVFFDELGLGEPAYRLEVGSGTHAEQTGRMLPGIERAIHEVAPEWVLVYGDTNSTLAGALAAAKVGVAVAHVEAGLRSFDRAMPEELNRIVVDRLSTLLLCPTEVAAANLAAEAITEGVHVVGDVMLDVSLQVAPLARERSRALEEAGVEPGSYLLLTLHREANMRGPELGQIVSAINRIGEPIVFPAHPRATAALAANGLQLGPHVRVIPPAGYLDFAALTCQARLVLTDSGGLQKEAYWYRVPCVTLRATSEWVETLETGWNRLVGSDPEAILQAVEHAAQPGAHPDLYGDGHAAERVAELLCTMGPQ